MQFRNAITMTTCGYDNHSIAEVAKKSKLSFLGGVKETFGFKPYRELMLMELFAWLAVQVVEWHNNYISCMPAYS